MKSPEPLIPGEYYHLYNRGNNRENIFINDHNYNHFLTLYARYSTPIAETYAYCLLRNHFHFLIRIKDAADLTTIKDPLDSRQMSQPFSNFFNAYSRAFNRAHHRTGALFQRPFGRIRVDSNAYFVQLVQYIHHNPQKHRFVSDFRDWPYSSYHALLTTKPTRLERAKVLQWFGADNQFAQAHLEWWDNGQLEALMPELDDD